MALKPLFGQKSTLKMTMIFLLPFLIAPIVGIAIPYYKNIQRRARESEVKLTAQAIHTAETSYRDVWKKYTSSLKDAGFPVTLEHLAIYTKIEEIPEADMKRVKQENLPFFGENNYQILLKHINKDNGTETFWILTETGIAEKLND